MHFQKCKDLPFLSLSCYWDIGVMHCMENNPPNNFTQGPEIFNGKMSKF
jgi:hypothetical protein